MSTALPPMPAPMQALPTDRHGRPVPWFVHWQDGAPDFRVIRARGTDDALRFQLCWVCGRQRGRHAAFVVGPMCAVNRTTAEPPCHLACAVWSAQACPFLATPSMTRRERGIDTSAEGPHLDPAGVMIARNPGVALVWSSRSWAPFSAPGGVLIHLGEPTATSWWAHGRPATRAEVLDSMDSGLPLLRERVEEERTEPARVQARAELERLTRAALQLVPA